MPQRVGKSEGSPVVRRKHFIRQWRKHREMTLEALAAEIGTSKGHLSNVEQLKATLTEDFLNAAALALDTDAMSLLMIDPLAGESIWAVWEKASPAQREQITNVARALVDSKV